MIKAVILIATLLFLMFVGGLLSTVHSVPPQPVSVLEDEEQVMIDLNNDYRETRGLNPLSVSKQLMKSSQLKADDLCKYNYWHHNDSKERPFYYFIKQTGYTYLIAGENLSKDYDTIEQTFDGLVKSPSHLENIIGKYNEIGVGINKCKGINYTVVHYALDKQT